jgi:TolA-binding protein
VRNRSDAESARTTQRTSSINPNRAVSAEDIRQAETAADIRNMQRRIDEMPEGLRRRTMQRMLDAQQESLDRTRAAEADRASRRSSQAARDRTRNRPEDVTLPEMPFSKGGMAKKKYSKGGMARKGYAKGGYANCGASVPPNGKSRK